MDAGLELGQITCIRRWQYNAEAFDPYRVVRRGIAAGCIVSKCLAVHKCHDLRIGTVIQHPAIWFAFFFAFAR